MPSRHSLNLRARVVGLDPTLAAFANDSKLEQKILYLEKNADAATGAAATGTLTSDNTNVSNNDTVTIGGQVYTFKTALTPAANEVLIGADADSSLTNLVSAINGAGTPGTDYAANTPVNSFVTAGAVAAHATTVTASNIAFLNTATTETSSHLSWGGATLSGGSPKVFGIGNAAVKSTAGGVSGDKNTSV